MNNPFEELQRTMSEMPDIIVERVVAQLTNIRQPEKEYLTVEETAKFLDCTTVHVYKLKSRIPYIFTGARLYFKHSDLSEYMERARVIPVPRKRR